VLCNAYLVPNINLDQYYFDANRQFCPQFFRRISLSNLSLRLSLKNHSASRWRGYDTGCVGSPEKNSLDAPISNKSRLSYRSASVGRWLLRVVTSSLPTEACPASHSPSAEVSGVVVNKALTDSRNQLAEKEFRAAKLYIDKEIPLGGHLQRSHLGYL